MNTPEASIRPPEAGFPPSAVFVRRLSAVSVICIVGSVAIGLTVRSHLPALDAWLHAGVLQHRSGADLDLARVVTRGGSTVVVWPMVAIAALTFPRCTGTRRWVTTAVVGAGAGAAIGVRLAVSLALRRPRPPRVDWVTTAGGFAFPSGHTTTATIGIGVLAWAVTRHLGGSWSRAAVWTAACGYAVAVGWSRVWLGVHWPLDVMGGWLLGAGWLIGMAAIASRWEGMPAPGPPRAEGPALPGGRRGEATGGEREPSVGG